MMEFRQIKLKELRKNKEMNQTNIAKIFGVTQHGWSQYEKGTRIPALGLAIEIAKYFQVNVEDIWV